MLKLSVTVEYLDGRTVPVTILPVTQVAFERHFQTSFTAAFKDSPAFEHLLYLAWHASRTSIEFDDWLETVEGVTFGGSEVVDPTPPEASATG